MNQKETDDFLQTLLDIAALGAGYPELVGKKPPPRDHISSEFNRAARAGEAEMNAEFEEDEL